MNEIINDILVGFAIAMIYGGILTILVVLFLNIFIMPVLKGRTLRKAREKGHIVEATRVDMAYPNDVLTERYIIGIYEYEYQGKRYKYKYRYVSTPPNPETLYFKRNPRKAKNIGDFGRIESYKEIFLFMTSIVFFIQIIW